MDHAPAGTRALAAGIMLSLSPPESEHPHSGWYGLAQGACGGGVASSYYQLGHIDLPLVGSS
jgi:hypothetical protein